MTVNALLEMPVGLYRGLVTGLESGECSARIQVRRIPGGCLAVDYEATSEREGLQHAEHTLVVPGGLYVAAAEMPGVGMALGRGRPVSARDVESGLPPS